MKKICLLFSTLCLLACEGGAGKRANREALHFRTTDDAELYFKNIRRPAYDHQEMAAAKLDVFRHEDRNQQATYPYLTPALAINWRYDEAYLILEANEQLGQTRPMVIAWQDSLRHQEGTYVLEGNNKMDQLRFAGQLYEGILDGQKFFLQTDTVQQPFLELPADRRVFRITMVDFYTLTGNVK